MAPGQKYIGPSLVQAVGSSSSNSRNILLQACGDGNDDNVTFLANKFPELVNSKDDVGDSALQCVSK